MSTSRRTFLGVILGGAAAATGLPVPARRDDAFSISLAQWSLHRELHAGTLDHLDFPALASREFDIHAVEYVNSFFQARTTAYARSLRARADDAGVRSLLIMCDGEGRLGDPDDKERLASADRHRAWLDAARELGCHSIRVNAASEGEREEQSRLAADGLARLTALAEPLDLNVIVENHGGLSSDGSWLAATIARVGNERCGTLPDFGNFHVSREVSYDRYRGVEELMPFAKAVSAKSYDFSDAGEETTIDYARMMRIVHAAGYRGHVGIEYEGERLPEREGIRATKRLLERVRATLPAG